MGWMPGRGFPGCCGLTCADQAGVGGSLGHLGVAGAQRVAHLHTGSCAQPQGDLQAQGSHVPDNGAVTVTGGHPPSREQGGVQDLI